MKALVTGTAGFVGSHIAMKLLERRDEAIGFDNLSDCFDINPKKARLARLIDHPDYTHIRADLADRGAVEAAFATHKPPRVGDLATQAAGENPNVYVSSNVSGVLHILEGCRYHGVEHLVPAPTDAVYDAKTRMPFSERWPTVADTEADTEADVSGLYQACGDRPQVSVEFLVAQFAKWYPSSRMQP